MATKKKTSNNVDPKILAVLLVGVVLLVAGWVYYQRTSDDGLYAPDDFQELDLTGAPEGIVVDESELPPDVEEPPIIDPETPAQDPAEIAPVEE